MVSCHDEMYHIQGTILCFAAGSSIWLQWLIIKTNTVNEGFNSLYYGPYENNPENVVSRSYPA